MAQHNERHSAQGIVLMQPLQLIQGEYIPLVAQQPTGLIRAGPSNQIGLFAVGCGLSLQHFGGPVPDGFGTHPLVTGFGFLGDLVVGDRQRDAESDLQSHLFADFTRGALGQGFAVVELAFGEGPVVVARAVDHQHLQLAFVQPPAQCAGGQNFGINSGVLLGGGAAPGHLSQCLGIGHD